MQLINNHLSLNNLALKTMINAPKIVVIIEEAKLTCKAEVIIVNF
jgi:hypothetical protein